MPKKLNTLIKLNWDIFVFNHEMIFKKVKDTIIHRKPKISGFRFGFQFSKPKPKTEPKTDYFRFPKPKTEPKKPEKTGFFGFQNQF